MLNDLTERIVGSALTVCNALGGGFLERYENALVDELRKAGLAVAEQRGIVVVYDEIIVGEYAVDLLVKDAVIVELNAMKAVADIHRPQCINYLRRRPQLNPNGIVSSRKFVAGGGDLQG